jgi:hypothetical protein
VRGQKTNPELVAQVTAALLAGMGLSEVARQYKIPVSSVSRIRDNLNQGELERVGKEKRNRIDEMLADSLETHLNALRSIAEVGSDKNYLIKQSPEGLTTLHERLEDHALRLLEAAGLVADANEDETA